MRKLQDRFVQSLVVVSGFMVLLVVIAIVYFLGGESRYAFQQGFGYGYRFALGPQQPPADYAIEFDPNSSLLASNAEGDDGLDEKEEPFRMPDLESLRGFAAYGTGTGLVSTLDQVDPEGLYRDDWRSLKPADHRDRMLLFAFATPEAGGSKMVLRWEPDASFKPSISPYRLRLRLVRAPAGVAAQSIDIDLAKHPQGSVEVPTWIAKSDDQRTLGYVFALDAEPTTNNIVATIRNFFRTDWAPTLIYPRFGFMPLLLGTLAIVGLAVAIATPISLALAVFLSEIAPVRLREWLKPVVELLASVPTVVLGYFGVMLVAPSLQSTFARWVQVDSGRMIATAAVVMAVLLIPTIATVAEDGLRNVPNTLRDGAGAMGLTAREGLKQVVFPAAKPGIIAAVLLGLARGIGETMIVWMLSGGTARMPVGNPLEMLSSPGSGIPDRIGTEMGNVAFEGAHYGHLFLLGATLYLITLAINLYGFRLSRRSSWQTS